MQRLGSLKNFLIINKKIVLLLIVVVGATLLLSSLVSLLLERDYDLYLPSIGNLKTIGVEVYMDEQLTNRSEGITWDNVDPGSTINETRYVRSISNENIDLSMITENWQYRNSTGTLSNNTDYVHLSWDSEGRILKPDQSTKVVFTLNVNLSYDFIQFLVKNQVQSFIFDIIIHPQEQMVAEAEPT